MLFGVIYKEEIPRYRQRKLFDLTYCDINLDHNLPIKQTRIAFDRKNSSLSKNMSNQSRELLHPIPHINNLDWRSCHCADVGPPLNVSTN